MADDIKNIIKSVIGRLSERQTTSPSAIQHAWDSLISDKEKKHSKIHDYHNGLLIVYVDSPAWLYQLNLKKETLLIALKSKVGEIKKISFQVGKL